MIMIAILVVALAGSSRASVVQDPLSDLSTATAIIKDYIKSLSPVSASSGGNLCTSYNCCNISASSECSLSTMAKDETTLVLPGGNTRCIYSYSSPFGKILLLMINVSAIC